MEINKILSASWLDILFDNRNKDYGAYELRNTYSRRISKAVLITFLGTTLLILATSFTGNRSRNNHQTKDNEGIILTQVDELKLPEPEPEPEPEPQEVKPEKTVQFTSEIEIKNDPEVVNPPASQDEIDNARIDVKTTDGELYTGIVKEPALPAGEGTGIIEAKKKEPEDDIKTTVQVQAQFIGNWTKFLLRYLDPDVPIENGAPDGRYTVVIQFVVDKEGNVSDIRPLTKIGYGMEEEAMRVIRKATKWEPAIQNGYKVKAYRSQPITFEVLNGY
ncbi:MAG TPA: energy transducer TonB [Chitinophagaceae bacterium]|nr:energy transducer TonB [Chitinophagales bacterium]HPG11680.1 energy transducer TonB [Chitinophagaceae bacterium]